ncbi:MAG: T9SS type A sorting domain-containing protein [Bacteroidia bacterium]|nr:T9SS type A sorting domain-containing protein [Bacteroidia bacterium]
MMQKITAFLFLFWGLSLSAQSLTPTVLASAGQANTVGNYYLEWTFGEMALIETFSAGGYHLTQGFHQPEVRLPTSVIEDQDFLEEMVVFPNPAAEMVNVRYRLKLPGTISIRLYSLNGVSVMLESEHSYAGDTETREFNLEKIAAGLYFVEVNYRSFNGVVEKTIFKKLSIVNQ